ncbi:MAG: hypothetical protein HY079_04515 [Elusimicrobia bacterium]|nr:hypothetical protein [Elusimicrobiota bacterium]
MDPKRFLPAVVASLLLSVPLSAGPVLDGLRASLPGVDVAVPATFAAQAVPPGSAISPEISDPVRTAMILKLIKDVYEGNPLPYPKKDGSVWTNKERTLPVNPDPNWYREYTLLPPAGTTRSITIGGKPYQIAPPQGTRGVERIIIGGGQVVYYTPDHYASFIQLTISR